jgi:hypothetical protein
MSYGFVARIVSNDNQKEQVVNNNREQNVSRMMGWMVVQQQIRKCHRDVIRVGEEGRGCCTQYVSSTLPRIVRVMMMMMLQLKYNGGGAMKKWKIYRDREIRQGPW